MTLDVQLQTMLVMMIGGFYLGISLDTFRRFSPYWKKKIVWTYILECTFWLSQTLLLFYVLYLINSGELRLYIFAACLLGFAMYQGLAASFYKRLLEKLITICKAIFRLLANVLNSVVFKPIKWLVFAILSIVLFTVRLLMTVVLFFILPVYKLLVSSFLSVYNLLPSSFRRILYKLAGFYSIIENTSKKWLTYVTFKRR